MSEPYGTLKMNRRAFFLTLIGVPITGTNVSTLGTGGEVYTLARGPVHAHDQERYGIGHGTHTTMVVFHPGNMLAHHMGALAKRGASIQLQAVVEK